MDKMNFDQWYETRKFTCCLEYQLQCDITGKGQNAKTAGYYFEGGYYVTINDKGEFWSTACQSEYLSNNLKEIANWLWLNYVAYELGSVSYRYQAILPHYKDIQMPKCLVDITDADSTCAVFLYKGVGGVYVYVRQIDLDGPDAKIFNYEVKSGSYQVGVDGFSGFRRMTDDYETMCAYIAEAVRDERSEAIEKAVDAGEQAFWSAVAKELPEIKTGDFSPHDTFTIQKAMLDAVKIWYRDNLEVE